MAAICEGQTEPDYFMFKYKPYHHGKNPEADDPDSQTLRYLKQDYFRDNHNTAQQAKKGEFYARFRSLLKKAIDECKEKGPVVIAIAPGHKRSRNPSGFMHEAVGEFLTLHPGLAEDGRTQLIRTRDVPKQAASKQKRDESTHRGTIAINRSLTARNLNKGKTVIILDDVWTSGSTLRVCKEVMQTTTPKQVKLLAIGRDIVGKKPEEGKSSRKRKLNPQDEDEHMPKEIKLTEPVKSKKQTKLHY